MRHQALRRLAVMLSVLLLAAPAKAGSISYADVAQTLSGSQAGRPRVELRLRGLAQDTRLTSTAQAPQGGNGASAAQDQQPAAANSGSQSATSGVDLAQEPVAGQVEVVDFGDVTGTVCNCGEIPAVIRPGGFPLWPLLGLGAIPLFFINGGDDETTTTTTPPPPPPPPPPAIPEPATLLLFGTGLAALGARARRRRGAAAERRGEAEQGINISEGN